MPMQAGIGRPPLTRCRASIGTNFGARPTTVRRFDEHVRPKIDRCRADVRRIFNPGVSPAPNPTFTQSFDCDFGVDSMPSGTSGARLGTIFDLRNGNARAAWRRTRFEGSRRIVASLHLVALQFPAYPVGLYCRRTGHGRFRRHGVLAHA